MKIFLYAAFFCGLLTASAAGAASAAEGREIYGRCARCHGDTGDKSAHILKGQDKAELLRKLNGYAEGSYGGEKKAVMHNVAKKLSKEDKEAVVSHIETF